MRSHISTSMMILACIGALSACATQTDKVASFDDVLTTSDVSNETPEDVLTPMVFAWNTGFSGFISAPIEVRREAHLACNERGFAVAVMAELAVDGDTVTAEFTCRGDAE